MKTTIHIDDITVEFDGTQEFYDKYVMPIVEAVSKRAIKAPPAEQPA